MADSPYVGNERQRDWALDQLAQALYSRMRHLEPNRTERKPWDELTEDEADFYECCAETLANRRTAIRSFWEASGLR